MKAKQETTDQHVVHVRSAISGVISQEHDVSSVLRADNVVAGVWIDVLRRYLPFDGRPVQSYLPCVERREDRALLRRSRIALGRTG